MCCRIRSQDVIVATLIGNKGPTKSISTGVEKLWKRLSSPQLLVAKVLDLRLGGLAPLPCCFDPDATHSGAAFFPFAPDQRKGILLEAEASGKQKVGESIVGSAQLMHRISTAANFNAIATKQGMEAKNRPKNRVFPSVPGDTGGARWNVNGP
jgi:hypothetical protein